MTETGMGSCQKAQTCGLIRPCRAYAQSWKVACRDSRVASTGELASVTRRRKAVS
jgi:hypothetical protein